MSEYIPENNYLATKYTPVRGFTEDLCTRCEKYYQSLYDKGITKNPFPPNCTKSAGSVSLALNPGDFDTLEEYQEATVLLDPIAWAQMELGWTPRFYQEDMIYCTSQYKLNRLGRRCFTEDTLIATPSGPKPIKDINVGDEVYDENANPVKVCEVYSNGKQEVVDLVHNKTTLATCTLNHRWLVSQEHSNIQKIEALEDHKPRTKIIRKEFDAPLGDVSEPQAYAIGALLGDGCSTEKGAAIYISSEDSKIPEAVRSSLGARYLNKTKSKNYTWKISDNPPGKTDSRNKLPDSPLYLAWCYGRLAHEKTVDLSVIKSWNRSSLLAFIAGLLDTDGSVTFSGKEVTIQIGMQAKPVIEAIQHSFLALWNINYPISIDNRKKYKNGPVYIYGFKNIHHAKRALKDLTPYLQVDRKKYKPEYDNLESNNYNSTRVGYKISNRRMALTYNLQVATDTNLYLLANGLVSKNSGKTEAMVVETLHHAVTNKNHSILIIAPYERQVTRFFDELHKLIHLSVSLKGSLARFTKTPSLMQFNNGTKILGFSAGATSGSGSDKIRGQDAHLIIIDEIDTLENKDIDATMAILASHKECKLIASTTPRGWRRRFYTYVTDKDLGFKEFWFISAESPEWSQATEDFFRGTTDPVTYTQEYLADFAELSAGVFKARCIDASTHDYEMNSNPNPNSDYILGIDWNKSAGTHMVILEHDSRKLKLVRKIVISETEYLQTDSVEMIINLNRAWKFKYIFVDAGYGSVQVELLKKHTLKEPSSMLDKKLFAIAMNQHLKVIDPLTGEEVKRSAKHFLIEQTKKLLEDGCLIMPKSEDTTISTGTGDMGLIQQMRNFRVEGTSVYGLPRYSQGEEHTLTAFYLAVGGFYWKEGDLKGAPYVTHINSVEVSDTINQTIHPSVIERERDAQSGWNLVKTTSRNHRPGPSTSRSIDKNPSKRHKPDGGQYNRRKF